MKPEEKQMENWMENLHGELNGLHLDGEAKRQILQKMKRTGGASFRYVKALALVAMLAAVLAAGLRGMVFEDRTRTLAPASPPESPLPVEGAGADGYHAVVYQLSLAGDKLWLTYDVVREKDKAAWPDEEGHVDVPSGQTETKTGIVEWLPFNEGKSGGSGSFGMKRKEKVKEQVVYIAGFSVLDEQDRVIGTWRQDGHSLLEDGTVKSSYRTADVSSAAALNDAAGENAQVRLRIEAVTEGSTVHTSLSDTVKEENGAITVRICVE